MRRSTSVGRCRPRSRRRLLPSRSIRCQLLATAVMILSLSVAGCDTDVSTETVPLAANAAMQDEEAGQAEMRRGLAIFRRATARYHRVEVAVADGFEQILPCLSNPAGEGAIGIPYAKLDRLDANIDLSEPEILFYEPRPDGRLTLVGGEPVVPIEAWPDSEPPSLFGREFHRNEEHGLFGLHMWVWRHSPDGVFSFWNSNVSCEFAR